MEATELQAVRSVIIPTGSLRLVVPSAAVAEVAAFADLLPLPGSAPGLVGVFQWRGVAVPVVAFETLLGQPPPRPSRRSKVVVLYPLSGRPRTDFFGILAATDPQSRSIGAEQVELADISTAVSNRFVASTFGFEGNTVGIPDLTAVRDSIRLENAR